MSGSGHHHWLILFLVLLLAGCGSATPEGATQLPPAERPARPPQPSAPPPTHLSSSPAPQAMPTASLPAATVPPTLPPPTEEAPPAPQVSSFSVVPEPALVNLGETLHVRWEATGERIELCPIIGTGSVGCRDVPPVGELHLLTDEASLSYLGLGLWATSGADFVWSLVDVTVGCEGLRSWFFADPPVRCPEAEPVRSLAAAQFFERGFMVWTQEPDQFFLFYEERFNPDSTDPRMKFERVLAPYTFGEESPISNCPSTTWRSDSGNRPQNHSNNRVGLADSRNLGNQIAK